MISSVPLLTDAETNRSHHLLRPAHTMSSVTDLFNSLNARHPTDFDAAIAWLTDHEKLLKLTGSKGVEAQENNMPRFPQLSVRAQEYAERCGYSTAEDAVTASQTTASTNGTQSTI